MAIDNKLTSLNDLFKQVYGGRIAELLGEDNPLLSEEYRRKIQWEKEVEEIINETE